MKRRLIAVMSLVFIAGFGLTSCKNEETPFVEIVNQTPYLGVPTDQNHIFELQAWIRGCTLSCMPRSWSQ